MKRLLGVLVAVVTSLVTAAPALAVANLNPSGVDVLYSSTTNTANQLTINVTASQFTIADPTETINTAVPGCSGGGTNQVTCPLGVITDISVFAGPLGDRVTANTPAAAPGVLEEVSFTGEDGNDELIVTGALPGDLFGSAGADSLVGGDGPDTLNGSNDVDPTMTGGAGDDTFSTVEAGETAMGGPGTDFMSVLGGTVDAGADDDFAIVGGAATVTGGDGKDTLIAAGGGEPPPATSADLESGAGTVGSAAYSALGFEDLLLIGGSSATARGDAGPNVIDAANGLVGLSLAVATGPADINPRGGRDIVFGSGFDDKIDVVDGDFDRVTCGGGTDTVSADPQDSLTDCESEARVDFDERDPECRFTSAKRTVSSDALAKGYKATVSCDERVDVEAELAVKPRGGVRLARPGELTLATRDGSAGAGEEVTLALKLKRSLAKRLPDRFRLLLAVSASDDGGNVGTLRRTIKVKPSKRGGR